MYSEDIKKKAFGGIVVKGFKFLLEKGIREGLHLQLNAIKFIRIL